MWKFDHFELDLIRHRILACGESHKTPIVFFSSMAVHGNRAIVYDENKPKFVFEMSDKDVALQKFKELNAFANRHFKISPSCFKREGAPRNAS